MIAANLGTDARRTSELAQDDDRAILVQAALMQILDEGTDALIEDGKVFSLTLEDGIAGAAVPVPFAVIQSDDASAGLDQAPGQQQTLGDARAPLPSMNTFGSPVP